MLAGYPLNGGKHAVDQCVVGLVQLWATPSITHDGLHPHCKVPEQADTGQDATLAGPGELHLIHRIHLGHLQGGREGGGERGGGTSNMEHTTV